MKTNRQSAIMDLITNRCIETQEELAEGLRELGYQVTQATVSRDIKQLSLIKVSTPEGKYRYGVSKHVDTVLNDRLTRILSDSLISVEYSENDVVVRTISGSANAACEALDNMNWPEILGSIAGDNTIFMIARSDADAKTVAERIRTFMHN